MGMLLAVDRDVDPKIIEDFSVEFDLAEILRAVHEQRDIGAARFDSGIARAMYRSPDGTYEANICANRYTLEVQVIFPHHLGRRVDLGSRVLKLEGPHGRLARVSPEPGTNIAALLRASLGLDGIIHSYPVRITIGY